MDRKDASHGLSCGNSLGDTRTEPGCEPGRFHLIGLGVYVQLHSGLQVWFTGLLRHGGTPPLVPCQYDLEGWEKRIFVISYPASAILSGEARHAFASLPFQSEPLYLPPEMTGAPLPKTSTPSYTNHCTIAQDGWVTMDRQSLVNFITRGILQQCRWILRQLPADFGVEVDANQFLRSVSYLEEGSDVRVQPDDWKLAPNSDVHHPFDERHKAVQDAYLKTENNRLIAGLPVITGNPYDDWDVTVMDYGHRTASTCVVHVLGTC